MGSKVLSTCSDNIGGLNWDDGTVGVGDESGVSSGIGIGVDGDASGGEVSGTGSLDSWLIDWDDGTVGVGNKSAGVLKAKVVGIRVSSIGIGGNWKTVSGEVIGAGSLDCWLINGDNSTVGVGNKLGAGNCDAGKENLISNKYNDAFIKISIFQFSKVHFTTKEMENKKN